VEAFDFGFTLECAGAYAEARSPHRFVGDLCEFRHPRFCWSRACFRRERNFSDAPQSAKRRKNTYSSSTPNCRACRKFSATRRVGKFGGGEKTWHTHLAKPAIGSRVLFTAAANDEFEFLDAQGEWIHVQISGESRGYIQRSGVELPSFSPRGQSRRTSQP